ncbi:EutP/PduV family microcompartment system protein [Fusibacter ferrireducens]|uniref:Uncharacterized protein n=1 Tax=Fusibacter ferrireducens TaxID=2785058 RepID=A0ABR9ZR62_9FIRM|nr:EutP/PduV family microcompartment system protein [Fusibacter ferrireducens]MBF4692430.1 hypothetical protein [Fusibacter ferrireducens]
MRIIQETVLGRQVTLAQALALYTYEADVAGLLISATDVYSLYPPNLTPRVNREVVGIVTQVDLPDSNPEMDEEWLKLSGCDIIYKVSAYTGEGLWQIFEHLREPEDVLAWDEDQF